MTERIISSINLERSLKKKLSRISNILDRTEFSICEDALQYYFQNSKIIQESLKKCREKEQFFKGMNQHVQLRNTVSDPQSLCGYADGINEEDEQHEENITK